MLNIILSMLIGSVITYLITVISSALKASTVLEDAMLTYALLIMSAYEVSVNQLEKAIVASEIEPFRVLRVTPAGTDDHTKDASTD